MSSVSAPSAVRARPAQAPAEGVRWMIRQDLKEVLALDGAQRSVGGGKAMTEKALISSLRAANCIGMVSETKAGIDGFAIYELGRDEFKLTRLAGTPAAQAMFIDRLSAKLGAQRSTLSVTVPKKDTVLRNALIGRGFTFETADVLVLRKPGTAATAPPAPVAKPSVAVDRMATERRPPASTTYVPERVVYRDRPQPTAGQKVDNFLDSAVDSPLAPIAVPLLYPVMLARFFFRS